MLRNLLDLVKDDARRLVNLVKTNDGSHNGETQRDEIVGNGKKEDIVVFNTLGRVECRVAFLLAIVLGTGRGPRLGSRL